MHKTSKRTVLLFTTLGIGSASAGTMGVDWEGNLTAIQGLTQLANGSQPDAINAQMIAMGTLTASVVLGIVRRIVMTMLTTAAMAGVAFTLLNLQH